MASARARAIVGRDRDVRSRANSQYSPAGDAYQRFGVGNVLKQATGPLTHPISLIQSHPLKVGRHPSFRLLAFCAPIGATSSCSNAKSSRREPVPGMKSFDGASIACSLILRAMNKASSRPGKRRFSRRSATRVSEVKIIRNPDRPKGLVERGHRKTQSAARGQMSARERVV